MVGYFLSPLGKMILFLPFVLSCSLLSVSSMDHSFHSSLRPSVCLSAPWNVCFLSLFTPVTIALSPLFFFLLPFICGLFLLKGTNVLLDEFLSFPENLI